MLKKKSLLLIEDDTVDALAIKRAIDQTGELDELIHVVNGEEGLAYLRCQDNETPFLIMLDLNMPRMNGLEFLEAIKNDQMLCRIPVVVLTTSTESCDIDETFLRSVAGYMVKPIDHDKLVQIIQTVSDYWGINVQPAR
ncbi:MAG: response regulator [Planctomycetes bacterium]|nr:response regulator [Planctomycetota bacterium]